MSASPEVTREAAVAGAAVNEAILLYDGVCGLCNRFVRFVLARDTRKQFRFASLQSPFAQELLRRRGLDTSRLDTVYLVTGHGHSDETLLPKSRAILGTLRRLGGGWSLLGDLLRIVPSPIRDALYDIVARVRYRVFGRTDRCPVPSPEHRDRFIDAGQGTP